MMRVNEVFDASQIAEVRRSASAMAERLGFDEAGTGRVAIVATEMATNLVKHGGGGVVLGSVVEEEGEGLVELLALDRGRGMSDVERCLEDGYSTQGSAGQGLGAIRRQSSAFDIASWPGLGTAVLARIGARRPGRPGPPPRWGAVRVALAGEEVCGDAFSVAEAGDGMDILVADGLGHGAGAAAASMEAVRVFERNLGEPPNQMIALAHAALRATRGAAVAVARIGPAGSRVTFSGLGNVAGLVSGPSGAKRMVSMNGTAGLAMHRIQAFDYPFEAGAIVILHTDGLSSSWSLDRYPGLAGRHPTLIAGVLWRDHSRGRDDATVVVAKGAPS